MEKEDNFGTRSASPEILDEKIIAHNLAEMNSSMEDLLFNESVGGNAWATTIDGKEYPCGAANGYIDINTGEIIFFGNYDTPEIRENAAAARFVLRVAVDFSKLSTPDKGLFFKIVQIFEPKNLSRAAKLALEESVRRWNKSKRGSGN